MSEEFVKEIQDLVGKQVVIFSTVQRETLHFSDFDHDRVCILKGKLKKAAGACLLLEMIHPGNKITYTIYIHSCQVNSIMEDVPGISIGDFYMEDGVAKRNR